MKIKIGDVIAKCVFNGNWQNEPVAVKKIKLDERSDTIKQLIRHPNVVSCLFNEDVEGFRYYAMQLCKSTLEKSLAENCDCYMGPLPIPENILCQLADGLEYLHEKKIFHGNLKPSNALVYINPTEKGKEAIMKWSLPGLSTKPLKDKEVYAMGFGDLETSELSFAQLCLADVFAEGVTFAYFLSEGKYQLDLEPSHPDNIAVINQIPSPEARTLILKMLSENLKDRISSPDVAKELGRIKEKLGEDLMVLRDDSSTITSIKQINSFLGKGGYSVGVYEGVWRRQRVAIKKILAINHLTINREEILRKLDHPNVIRLYGILKDENFRYFVMELCVASLDKLFKNDLKGYNNGPKLVDMPPPEDVFIQSAEGMSYIHKLNLSHRDIKPHNVLIYVKQETSNETSNNVILKWTDFGGSKKVNIEGEGSMSDFKFTYNWCSPEVLKPLFYDTTDASKFNQKMIKSDIFSEGLVFACYLLEGKHLYGSSSDEIRGNLIDNNPINLPAIEGKHKQLSIVIKTMLETKPNLRPSSQEVTEKIASIKSLKEKAPVNTLRPQFDSNAIIGKGTNSIVYLGKFGPEGFQVAVKEKNLSEPEIRFGKTEEKEIKELILNLSHENIVRLYDVLNDGNNVWLFTMEYCIASMDHIFLPPEDTQKYNGPLPNRDEVLIQLASGLEYIHLRTFYHGNIKPQSVLIVQTDNKITMKLGNLKIWQTLTLGCVDRRSQFYLWKELEELLQELKKLQSSMEEPRGEFHLLKELEEQMKKREKRGQEELEEHRRGEFHLLKKLKERMEERDKLRWEKMKELERRLKEQMEMRVKLTRGEFEFWEELEGLTPGEFYLLRELEGLGRKEFYLLEKLEEHMKKREEHRRGEFHLLEQLEEQMKKREVRIREELRRREFHLSKELEELKKRDLCKAGHIFRYYLLRGQTPFDNLEREPFDDLKVSSINCLNQLILEMVHWNCSVSSSEVVKRLQSMKKDMDDKLANLLETNPPNLEEIKSIVECIVDINCEDENGLTLLLRFIQLSKGDYLLEVISLLLERGVDVNHKDGDGWNALYFLCYYHQQKDNLPEIISLLIDHKIDVNCKDKEGKNILHWLCENYEKDNLCEIIRLMIEHGKFELDQKGTSKENILHFYCQQYKKENFIDIVKIFIDNGVEVVSEGTDARHFITNKKFPKRQNPEKIIELMKEKM